MRSEDNNRPRLFVIKINAHHYRKLRVMFNSCYCTDEEGGASSSHPSTTTNTTTAANCIATNGGGDDRANIAYRAALFTTIVRYSTLLGGQQINDLRGGGMQGAIHDSIFNCLSKWFSESRRNSSSSLSSSSTTSSHRGGTKCFTSTFNSAMPNFSAFPSPGVDGHFGLCGDFFLSLSLLFEADTTTPPGGPRWFELNPPFSPGLMTNMAIRVGKLMEVHNRKGSELMCIIVIPTVRVTNNDRSCHMPKSKEKMEDKKRKRSANGEEGGEESSNAKLVSVVNTAAKQSFHMLVNSLYCKSQVILPTREHGFIKGGQDLRPTKFKESQCSTSVIILGSKKGWTGANDAKVFENELREAFTSKHRMEIEQRKCASKGC
ncbi:hypothetical protein ACHAXA_006438 [Cyclostephanos tholiformis]|uniref:PCIF1 WW domain-containing protein n=1 Tax=Cyclostephanos tholiformis TaxID=382380 RepID=A0ABD3SFP5_9STRA